MKLHLMASFRSHLRLRDEEILAAQSSYQEFWCKISKEAVNTAPGFGKVFFLHKTNERGSKLSRFRNVSTDSLLRPLHVLEIQFSPECATLTTAWRQAIDKFPLHSEMLAKLKLICESNYIRIYNHSVVLFQIDLDVSDFVKDQLEENVAERLDALQEFGVTFGEIASQLLYREHIYGYLQRLAEKTPDANRFIFVDYFDFDIAMSNAVVTEDSTENNQTIRVNWVTRALLVESRDKNNLSAIITHWLKDNGDQKLVDEVRKDPGAYAIRWLNYLFREQSYSWTRNDKGAVDYFQPFANEWRAMLNAQYYYAAFETLNDSLTFTLSHSYRKLGEKGNRSTSALRELGRQLEQDIITANLATLEYHNNFAYYNRSVGVTMKQIMGGWDFEEAILKEVSRKTTLCEQRINELHKKAESRSSFYSDLLLLAIALISVSAFLFQINQYGRTISHDADLAVYESNSWNLIKYISEQPTDFVIWLSLALIGVFGALYAWFRRLKVMD